MERVLGFFDKKSFLLSVLVCFGGYLFGNVLHEIILFFEMRKPVEEQEMTVFPLGTLMLTILFFLCLVIIRTMEMVKQSQLCISMGATRLEFYCASILNLCIWALVSLVSIVAGALLEALKFKLLYSTVSWEINFLNPLFLYYIIILLIPGICIGMLLAALNIRFGKNALWVFWGIYMVVVLFATRLKELIQKMIEKGMFDWLFRLVSTVSGGTFLLGLGIAACVACLVGGWFIIRKLEVRV